MSLFEWLGESFDPGGIGGVEVRKRPRANRPRAAVLACFIVAGVFLALWAYTLWSLFEIRSFTGLAGATGLTLLYLLISYVVHPQPDTENIGWLGGLFDHPFRYSDDINRFLIFLVIVLWPGRFVSESMVDMWRLLVHTRDHGPG